MSQSLQRHAHKSRGHLPPQTLLDWKLDFNIPDVAEKYDSLFNVTAVKLTRVCMVLVAFSAILQPIIDYFVLHKPWDSSAYVGVCAMAAWSVMWFILSFLRPVIKRGGILSAFACSSISTIFLIANVVIPYAAYYDNQAYTNAVFFIAQPMLLRHRCKHYVPFAVFNAVFHFVSSITVAPGDLSFHARLGYSIPNVCFLLLGTYTGYFFERRTKYDFFRRIIMDEEAEKLLWVSARDTSLLRNIFPKNLSDELEVKISRQESQGMQMVKSTSFVGKSLSSLAAIKEQLASLSNKSIRRSRMVDRHMMQGLLGEYSERRGTLGSSTDSYRDVHRGPFPLEFGSPSQKTDTSQVRLEIGLKRDSEKRVDVGLSKSGDTLKLRGDSVRQLDISPRKTESQRHMNIQFKAESQKQLPPLVVPLKQEGQRQLFPISPNMHRNFNTPFIRKVESQRQMGSRRAEEATTVGYVGDVKGRSRAMSLLQIRDTGLELGFTDRPGASNSISRALPPLSIPGGEVELDTFSRIAPITLPPVFTTPTPRSSTEIPSPFISTSGTPLYIPDHKSEVTTYLHGAQHTDGTPIALSHSYPNVVVIFADIVGFTNLSSTITPRALVRLLNELFNKFDDIMDQHNLEKIRTVGDAYLCVANMSMPIEEPEKVALCAGLKMIQEVHQVNNSLSLRVGIASGPVIAGVTGITKWNYDIFGKPLADANTVETLAPPNCVAVTETIYSACISTGNSPFDFSCMESEYPERYYVVPGEQLNNIPTSLQTNALEGTSSIKNDLQLLADPELNYGEMQGIDMSDIMDDYYDPEFFFEDYIDNFTKGTLDYEEALLKSSWVNPKFSNKELEVEYQLTSVKSAHKFTAVLCLIFAFNTILYLLTDIAISPSGKGKELHIAVLAGYPGAAVLFLVYIVFTRYFDFYRFAHHVAFFVAVAYTALLVMVFHFMPTDSHITWAMLSIMSMAGFIRVSPIKLFIGQLVVSGFALASIELSSDSTIFSTRFFITVFIFMVLTLLSKMYFEKSFRSQFIIHKRILCDMYHQKLAQQRSELLLHNILPESIIPRLQPPTPSSKTSTPSAANVVGVVDMFEQATIMFVHLTNLETLTAHLDPGQTFQVYNSLFTLYDEVTHAFGLEKIKTINSVYMVACGLPNKIPDHVELAIKLAIEIYKETSNFAFSTIHQKFEVRIGIATGPVVAGIIGKKKYSYDCWSDTVNTASRMESNGWNGYLQATAQSYELVQHKEYFQKREKLMIKGKGIMDTYVLQLSKFA